MADEHGFPLGIMKTLMLMLAGFGLTVYITLTLLWLIPEGQFFDVGLFSFSIVFILFGIVGYFVAHFEQKRQKEQQAAAK